MPDSIMPSISILPMTLVAWAATYFLHSTLLIGCIWSLTRLLGMRRLTVQDKLWKVALTGALFSCTVQTGLGDGAIAPRIVLPPVSFSVIPLNEHLTPATVDQAAEDAAIPDAAAAPCAPEPVAPLAQPRIDRRFALGAETIAPESVSPDEDEKGEAEEDAAAWSGRCISLTSRSPVN
jgi:hypothetical protein